jgi:hypothetical protein
MRSIILILMILLLAACNLQQQPATTPTPAPPDNSNPQTVPTVTPQPGMLPTLRPTPTQLTLTTVTSLPQPTTLDFGSEGTPGTPGPRLDSAQADDSYELQARAGSTFGLNYDITLIRGTVELYLQGPEGLLWQKTFTSSETGRHEITSAQGGTYEVLVDIENFDGNYALSWD